MPARRSAASGGALSRVALSGSFNYLLNVLALGTSRVLGMGAGFFCFVLFARILGSEALGRLAFVMAFVTIAGNIADFGTNSALARSLTEHRERDPGAWFGTYLLVRGGLALLTVLLGVLASLIVGGPLRDAMLLGIVATPFMAARFYESFFQIFGRPHFSVYSALVVGCSQVALCTTLLLLGGGLNGYLAAFATSQLIYFCFSFALCRSLTRPRFTWRPEFAAALFRLAMPMGVNALAMAVYSRADVFMLTYWRTSHEVGLYNAAYRLLDLGILVAVTVALPLVPIMTRRLEESRAEARALCTELLGFVATALLPAAIITAALAGRILELVYGPAFRAAAPVLSIFGWLFLANSYWLVASSINLAAANMKYNYWLTPLAGVANLGLNFYCIPRYGALGAAMGAGASILITLLVVMWNVQRSIGNVHSAGLWLRILACGMTLHVFMKLLGAGAPALDPLLCGALGLLVYGAMASTLGLVPARRLREILAARRAVRA